MSTSVGVRPQKQVVFILVHLNHEVKISTLKVAIEDEIGVNNSRVHALKRSISFDCLILKTELFLDVFRDVFRCYSKLEDVLVRNVFMKHQRVSVPRTNVH